MNTEKSELKAEGNGIIADVSGSSLAELCDLENAENRRKAFDNRTKGIDEIEPFDNTHFLNLIKFLKKNCH